MSYSCQGNATCNGQHAPHPQPPCEPKHCPARRAYEVVSCCEGMMHVASRVGSRPVHGGRSRLPVGSGAGPSPGPCAGCPVRAGRRDTARCCRPCRRPRLSGFLRGLPGPVRGTRIFSSTGSNCVQSARCPGVTTRDSGRQQPSALRWTLVVNPPRERPRPSPPAPPPPGGRRGSATASRPGGSRAQPPLRPAPTAGRRGRRPLAGGHARSSPTSETGDGPSRLRTGQRPARPETPTA